jgi:S-formylglutathione hydrolase FrmB
MKILMAVITLIPWLCLGQVQYPAGKVVVERITSKSLQNSGGENPTRRVSVYLPPDYDRTTNRYPVIYYLHGFSWSDSLQIASDHFDQLLDKAIGTGKIRPVIVVLPNEHTLYRGSMYTNSTLTGNWADFTAKELVAFIDEKYRTIVNSESRGITGHSMGGYGAIKLGMQYPDVYSSVYALSPGHLAFIKDIGAAGPAYRRAGEIQTREELNKPQSTVDFVANALVATGRAFTPNPNKPPFYADLPYTYEGGTLKVNNKVLEIWTRNSPLEMADELVGNLRKLKALKLDWGRNEQFTFIPMSCMMFSQKLENLGVNHYAEEYIGNHSNRLWTDDGRALNVMLPFFNSYLTFEETKYAVAESKKKAK